MGFFNVLGKFNEKRQRKKATAAGISGEDYDKYQKEKAKKIYVLEQRLKREREEKALKEKYSRPAWSLRKTINPSRIRRNTRRKTRGTRRYSTCRPKQISTGPQFGLVRDPFERSDSNPWTSENKKKKNPWLD